MIVALEAAISLAHRDEFFFVFLETGDEGDALVDRANSLVHAPHMHADAFDAYLEPERAAIGGMNLSE